MKTGILYAGINDIPNIVQLVENKENTPDESANLSIPKAGNLFYMKNCSACHGENLKGNGQFPSLLQVEQRLKPDEAKSVIKKGRGMMPSFSKLSDEEINAIIS